MEAVWWIAGLVVVVPVAWFVLKVATGALTPAELSGRLLLKQKVREFGGDPDQIPEACFREITADNVRVSKMFGDACRENWREHLIESTEASAN